MKIKNKILICSLFLAGALLLFINGCSKDDNDSQSNPTNGKTTAVFNPNLTYGTMTDQDGNIYKTITIGTQTWMAENLRTTKYRNGDPIPTVTDNTEWAALTAGAYCNYDNSNNNDSIATFGRLYNWYAATDTRNIAPAGWHLPTNAEWAELTEYLGGEGVAGGKLKEIGITHWTPPNTGATNETGFTALAGGSRGSNGTFHNMCVNGFWWTATRDNADMVWGRSMRYNGINFSGENDYNEETGVSLRCLRD